MGLLAVAGLQSEMAGIIVYWRLSGSVSHASFASAWTAEGLPADLAPSPVSVETAVHRAAKSLKQPGRLVWREKSTEAWTIAVNGRTEGEHVLHNIECRVGSRGGAWLEIQPANHPWAAEISDAFASYLDTLQAVDFSGWLVKQAERHHDAVSLRDTGGFYFLPPHAVPGWRRLSNVVNSNTDHKVYEIPAMHSDQAIDAVVDAVASEARALAEKMEAELLEGNLGPRALEGRKSTCADVLAKIGRYESLLGRQLDTLRGRVEAIQAELVAGELSAMDGKEDGNAVA